MELSCITTAAVWIFSFKERANQKKEGIKIPLDAFSGYKLQFKLRSHFAIVVTFYMGSSFIEQINVFDMFVTYWKLVRSFFYLSLVFCGYHLLYRCRWYCYESYICNRLYCACNSLLTNVRLWIKNSLIATLDLYSKDKIVLDMFVNIFMVAKKKKTWILRK